MTISASLVGAGIALALVTGTGFYIHGQSNRIDTLKSDKLALEGQVSTLRTTIKDLSVSKEELDKKIEVATATNKDISAKLAAAKTRVRYVKVPTECEPALNWLMDEVTK